MTPAINRRRLAKKTETFEIRLPPATKAAFMDRCRHRGLTASEAIRRFIDGELRQSPRRPLGWRPLLAGIAAGMALGAVAAPSLAQAVASRAAFDRLDRNHDGIVTFAEFRAR